MHIGIIGGGQLGQMLALAAYPLGVRCTVLDPAVDPCAAQVCSHIQGEFSDPYALEKLANLSDVVTYEFENVPIESVKQLSRHMPVFPPPRALEVSQDRLIEKNFFRELGIPTPNFASVDSDEELQAAVREIGLPAVLKTRRFGYDGKGQFVIRNESDLEQAWSELGGHPLILEGFVEFDRELSVVAARCRDGSTVCWPLIENEHRVGILHRSLAPASGTGEELTERAQEFILRILNELEYVGVLTMELFQDGPRLLANEMAPRVHNSGHWTIEGSRTSQFENHIRAILGLPLGVADALGCSAMFNFIGSVPPVLEILRHPEAHLHVYGKSDRPGRKVGHVTLHTMSEGHFEEKLPEWSRLFERKA